MNNLAVQPAAVGFGSKDEGALYERLRQLDQSTVLYPISSERELTLNEDGTIAYDGFRLTTWALFQLCHYLCSGLYRVLIDLAGPAARDNTERRRAFDVARETLNKVVKLRFTSELYGKQILRDTENKLVEGIVGHKYKWLSNKLLYERVREAVTGGKQPASFCCAALNGRWMLLRFYNRERYFATQHLGVEDRFYRGYHFSNHEVGRASIRAAALLIRSLHVTSSISPITAANRVRHAGRQFDRKLNKLIGQVTTRTHPALEYLGMAEELKKKTLALEGPAESKNARMEEIAVQLANARLGLSLARKIVAAAVLQGSYDDKPRRDFSLLPEVDWRSRTYYDLYNAIGREAKNVSISVRERAEQVAYSLLFGRLALD